MLRGCPRLILLLLLALRGPAEGAQSPAPQDQPHHPSGLWWAFRPLQGVSPPRGLSTPNAGNPLDAFLAESGHECAPEADRRTLLRRATFDLLGIPPTPEQARAFLADPSPDAWSRLVDRLLERPEYGERWARHWLDVARFAESSGFEHDYDRAGAYHYRDFVIQALNADLPYDQFVRWQIAGDELAPGDPQALMATGFLAAGVFPTQITANEVERTRYDALDDMLSTTSAAFLGLTVGCARCHDHKYDPIPTRDYYRMLSTFTTTVRSELELDLDPEETRRRQEAFDRDHAPRVAARTRYEAAELPSRFQSWWDAGAPLADEPRWELLEVAAPRSEAGATFLAQPDGSWRVTGTNAQSDTYHFSADVTLAEIRAVRLEALADPSLPQGGPGRADNGNIGLSRILLTATPLSGGTARPIAIRSAKATFEQNTTGLSIASALDDQPGTGWAVDPRFGTNHTAVFHFAEPLRVAGGVRLGLQLDFAVNTRHQIGRPRLAVSAFDSPDFEGPALPSRVAALLSKCRSGRASVAELAPPDRELLMTWWRVRDPGWLDLQNAVEDHARAAPVPRLTKVLVGAEGYPAVRMHTQGGDFLPETHLLQRGSPELKRGVATPGVLSVLLPRGISEDHWRSSPPEGARYSGRRSGLAAWMTDTRDGAGALLARVIVNRLWQHHFGGGLVATPNDFGVQGTPPTHPELLDWLAEQLLRSQWRLKPIHRLIMNSAAYRQAVVARPDASPSVDRIPRRLEAEALRDSLLAVCGEWDARRFGPGVRDTGSPRRSVYLTIKRSELIPVLQAFDAPEPLVSQGTRPTTTVAPQALFLMNSPEVRRWAAALSQQIAPFPEADPDAGITDAYWRVLIRAPSAVERTDAREFLAAQQTRHRASANADPHRAAWTDFLQVLLGLNEFIYVD